MIYGVGPIQSFHKVAFINSGVKKDKGKWLVQNNAWKNIMAWLWYEVWRKQSGADDERINRDDRLLVLIDWKTTMLRRLYLLNLRFLRGK